MSRNIWNHLVQSLCPDQWGENIRPPSHLMDTSISEKNMWCVYVCVCVCVHVYEGELHEICTCPVRYHHKIKFKILQFWLKILDLVPLVDLEMSVFTVFGIFSQTYGILIVLFLGFFYRNPEALNYVSRQAWPFWGVSLIKLSCWLSKTIFWCICSSHRDHHYDVLTFSVIWRT